VLLRDRLDEHERRRRTGLPTLTVLAGPPLLGARAWNGWAAARGRRVVRCGADEALAAWITCAVELVEEEHAGRTAHEREMALGPALAEACRADCQPERAARRLLEHLGERAPVLLVEAPLATSARRLAAVLEAHPTLALALAGPATRAEIASVPGRARVLLDEGYLETALGTEAVARRLAASGMPPQPAVAAAERLAAHGVDDDAVTLFVEAATAGGDRGRSAAEQFLFDRLESRQDTAGLFARNARVACGFHAGGAEVDLLCERHAVAVEIDGYHHFRDPEAYRRDRRKDLELQKSGYLVVRFLADDVVARLETVLDTITAALELAAARGPRP
jgi:very-short-patch-repair endonuclease